MDEKLIANLLSIIYPYVVVLFWVLILVATVWAIVKLVKKSQRKTEK